MTFYEAALRILESEGRPLHFLEITEKSIAQNLLSHVGKTPEQTMLSRLAAMARRTRDRRVIVTAKDTFGLVEWSIPEDAEALAQTGIPEANPEEDLPPLRPVERHPEPRTENARATGRGTDRKARRREEEEEGRGKRRRFPPLAEVAFEVLSDAEGALTVTEVLERARTRELAPEDLAAEALLLALAEDNQRRVDAGRRVQFGYRADAGQLALERGEPNAAEVQQAFATALALPFENGRIVFARAQAPAAEGALIDPQVLATARTAVKEARRAVARALRKRLGDADVGTFEKAVVKMMHGLGFRELKVAKRSKEGPLLTARKREGSVELRYAVRLLKGTSGVDRRAVQELRRDLGHYSAQVGLIASAGDVRGDAKTEAQASGALVMLWCADALGEKFLEARTAVTTTQVELFELDEPFFEAAQVEAEEAQKRREERHRERKAREDEEGEEAPVRERKPREEPRAEQAAPAAPAAEPVAAAAVTAQAEAAEGEDEEGEEEGEGGAEAEGAEGAAPGQGERKRRRRRRRGRRGRGNREGAPAEAGATPAEGAVPPEGAAPGEAAPAAAAETAAAVEGNPALEGAPATPEPAAEASVEAAPVVEAVSAEGVVATPSGEAPEEQRVPGEAPVPPPAPGSEGPEGGAA